MYSQGAQLQAKLSDPLQMEGHGRREEEHNDARKVDVRQHLAARHSPAQHSTDTDRD